MSVNRFSGCFHLLLYLLIASYVNGNPLDSIKTEVINGKKFIIHQVEQGQGLYAIARRYSVSVHQIAEVNLDSKKMNKGDLIRIPLILNDTANGYEDTRSKIDGKIKAEIKKTDSVFVPRDKTKIDEAHANADAREAETNKIHIVLSGETVNRIAQKYKIKPQLLVKWNGIRNNKIEIGQELIVNGSLVIKPYERWNTPNSVAPKNIPPQNILSSVEVIEETGFAAVTTDNTILHKTAPIGTILLITDLDSGKQSYCKVTGKLEQQYTNVILMIDSIAKQSLNSQADILRISIKYPVQ